jgi:hypothetical protein
MKLSDVMNKLVQRTRPNPTPPPPRRPVSPAAPQPSVIDLYVSSAPSPQNALDIFQGEWSSLLPSPLKELKVGNSQLFEDDRISWLADQVGGVSINPSWS